MASLGEDIRSAIVGSTAILAEFAGAAKPHACEQNTYPENPPDPRIYFRRAREETDRFLNGDPMTTESEWDVECIGTGDDTVLDLAAVVKSTFDGHSGTFGARTVQAVFVEDHDDDYIPRGVGSEDGFTVAALRLRIFST
jgi:hypothetical protein